MQLRDCNDAVGAASATADTSLVIASEIAKKILTQTEVDGH